MPTPASLRRFIVTAGTFGACSVFGFVTKKDLTSLGGFLFMALIGLIIASVVNMFFASSALYWLITYAGVFIFIGLTAYDTQKLKMIAIQTENSPDVAARLSVVGAGALSGFHQPVPFHAALDGQSAELRLIWGDK